MADNEKLLAEAARLRKEYGIPVPVDWSGMHVPYSMHFYQYGCECGRVGVRTSARHDATYERDQHTREHNK